MALQAFIPETCLWGCIDSNFFPLCWMRGHVCSDFVALCDRGCRGERMKWGACSCSLSFSRSNFRWKHVLDTLSKHHNSLENSLNGSLQRRTEGEESCINDKCLIWSTALFCSLSIFYHSLRHSHIFSFIVFFSLSLLSFALLPSRVYFPVAHSTLLGYFLWYTNVSLSFYISVYPPLPCLPVHSLRLLSLLTARCFPSLSSSIMRLSPLVCCNIYYPTPGGSRSHSLAQYVAVVSVTWQHWWLMIHALYRFYSVTFMAPGSHLLCKIDTIL